VRPPRPPFQDWHDHYTQAAFLDGGKRIVAVGTENGLQVVDLAQRKELYRVDGARRLAVSPDERTLAIAAKGTHTEYKWLWENPRSTPHSTEIDLDATISLLDADSGKAKRVVTVNGSAVWALAFSPDGKTLAASSGRDDGRIHLFDIASGATTQMYDVPPLRPPTNLVWQ
jgi:WD40 repeat protein